MIRLDIRKFNRNWIFIHSKMPIELFGQAWTRLYSIQNQISSWINLHRLSFSQVTKSANGNWFAGVTTPNSILCTTGEQSSGSIRPGRATRASWCPYPWRPSGSTCTRLKLAHLKQNWQMFSRSPEIGFKRHSNFKRLK